MVSFSGRKGRETSYFCKRFGLYESKTLPVGKAGLMILDQNSVVEAGSLSPEVSIISDGVKLLCNSNGGNNYFPTMGSIRGPQESTVDL